jgi:NaMN:DMB phosphoribosyltransferase
VEVAVGVAKAGATAGRAKMVPVAAIARLVRRVMRLLKRHPSLHQSPLHPALHFRVPM